MEKTALIAMSGGVDSSVAAYLTVSQGFKCMGTTMRLYTNEDLGLSRFHTCCSQKNIEDAAQVAFDLDIPYEVLDLTVDFKEKIIEKFIRTYESGGTPNPCIDCNRYMKFDKLLEFAEKNGLYYIVTGHYAAIEERDGRFLLKKALDPTKDQSYVLYSMTQRQLRHTLFPMGGLLKTETRKIAEQQGFINSKKPDSQDICFVPDGDYVKFMEEYTGRHYPDGDFINESGKIIGRHHGAVRYTVGQRKGLGLAFGKPVYVFKKDMKKNTVSVGDESLLFSKELSANDMNWIAFDAPNRPIRVKAKTRYRQAEQWATVYPNGADCIDLIFDEPQRAITSGQAVVLYDGDIVVGGGTITQVKRSDGSKESEENHDIS
ncbi:MAG: tRNA 2-thiouridine(34) synthase MnmA [Oscillospiraceae bacterium]|nr:tRNA 2-thiouridine(34) synthase MnmA [Oscillospiraceae bacterium]